MSEFRGIIRVADKDIKGDLSIARALTRIKGIGNNMADSIAEIAVRELKIPKDEKVGNLSDKQVDMLEKIIEHPENHGIPEWMLNRRKDKETGKDIHMSSSDLDFQKRQDIEQEKNIRSYRGVRHMFKLPLRGQRTRTTGRKGMTMGVVRKKQAPAKKKKGDKKK